ncbi:MAG: hypothetical protein GY929_08305, partial [Actinomycetia bacterium]|nr:hypothetical protein [Actinomycetes bacterium]
DIDGYRALLTDHGFVDVMTEDISAAFLRSYREVMDRLAGLETELSERFSPRVFTIIADKNGSILRAFEEAKFGGGRFVARKPR